MKSTPPVCIVIGSLAALASGGCVMHDGAVRVAAGRIDPQAVPIVHGFNARYSTVAAFSPDQFARIHAAFSPAPASAWEERQCVRRAVALFEQFAGEQTPIRGDLPFNQLGPPSDGQVDCVGEAANTTVFLLLLEQRGLLVFHAVLQPSFRSPYLVNPHNSARLCERFSGREYVVDSWFRPNGEPPLIQSVDTWRRMQAFPPEENPELKQ